MDAVPSVLWTIHNKHKSKMTLYKHQLVHVEGKHKYTNPGGFVQRGGQQYVIARRNPASADMATSSAVSSDIVLLERKRSRLLVDTGVVLLKGDLERGVSYEDPRLIHGEIGFTYTYVSKSGYSSWLMGLHRGNPSEFNKQMRPDISPSKNGFLFRAGDDTAIVVSRPDLEKEVRLYKVKDIKSALRGFTLKTSRMWWEDRFLAKITVPSWLRGERGSFGHVGFGTIIHPRAAVIHFGRGDETGKYYVTALQRLSPQGAPDGPPEIIAEPASELPEGDVPGVIYTQMAWLEGKELVLWSGHDDSMIVETRLKAPRWVVDTGAA